MTSPSLSSPHGPMYSTGARLWWEWGSQGIDVGSERVHMQTHCRGHGWFSWTSTHADAFTGFRVDIQALVKLVMPE